MSTPSATALLGSTLPPHLSGASPTTYYCGNMVWQNLMESGKKILQQKKEQEPRLGTTNNLPVYTELHHVAFSGSNERTALENASYEHINRRDHNGNTPLIWAASQGSEQLVEALVDQGAMVNLQNFVGETALYLAAARGYEKICALLMENGADSRLATLEGSTPVHIAAAGGHMEVLKVLTSHGAFVNVADEEGDTPLHYAVREGQVSAVELLAKHLGADPALKNEDLESPLDLAQEFGETTIIDILTKLNGNTTPYNSDHPLYFGEDDMHLERPKKDHPADAYNRAASFVPIY